MDVETHAAALEEHEVAEPEDLGQLQDVAVPGLARRGVSGVQRHLAELVEGKRVHRMGPPQARAGAGGREARPVAELGGRLDPELRGDVPNVVPDAVLADPPATGDLGPAEAMAPEVEDRPFGRRQDVRVRWSTAGSARHGQRLDPSASIFPPPPRRGRARGRCYTRPVPG